MQDATFDPSVQAVLDARSCSPGASNLTRSVGAEERRPADARPLQSASITDYRPERVVIEAHLDEAGLLLLTDAWYPGWHATVDGQRASVCRADLLFRAVELEAGSHRVVFEFRPHTLWLGGAASASGLVVILVAAFVFRRVGC
jgi:uncharacterized membrane protein YfhO